MSIRTLLVDDEKPARDRLKRLLSVYPRVEILGEASDGITALEKAAELKPDLIFLDIEMPELDGLGVAQALKGTSNAKVVFVTAYNEHALQAFELSVVDYIVKPVEESRLRDCLSRVERTLGTAQDLTEILKKLRPARGDSRFAVRCGSRFVVLDPAKISAIVARDHYAEIITEGKQFLADDSLDALESRLDSESFLRVHRSAMINLGFLAELEREGDRKYTAVLSDTQKTRVQVSREKLNELKDRLGI